MVAAAHTPCELSLVQYTMPVDHVKASQLCCRSLTIVPCTHQDHHAIPRQHLFGDPVPAKQDICTNPCTCHSFLTDRVDKHTAVHAGTIAPSYLLQAVAAELSSLGLPGLRKSAADVAERLQMATRQLDYLRLQEPEGGLLCTHTA